MSTPPGWYRDPGLPSTERWWDGAAWSAHTRPTGHPAGGGGMPAPAAPAAPVGSGASPGSPGGPGGGPRGRGGLLALLGAGVAVVVVAALAVVVLRPDPPAPAPTVPSRPHGAPSPTGDEGHGGAPTAQSPSTAPSADPGLLVDQLNGITLPVPKGWEKPDDTVLHQVTMWTRDYSYCPGDSSDLCHPGRVTTTTPAAGSAATPQAAAEQDIADAADATYGTDAVGDRIYGGITSHSLVAAKRVEVAGGSGYLVRWRVVTGHGPGGYVESLAFPSAVGSHALVIVRFAFDAGAKGPEPGLIDTITRGIRSLGGGSGGVGSSVAP